jgi:hypothetical protein
MSRIESKEVEYPKWEIQNDLYSMMEMDDYVL